MGKFLINFERILETFPFFVTDFGVFAADVQETGKFEQLRRA